MTYELFLNQKIFMFFVIFRPCNIQSPLCTNVHSIYYTIQGCVDKKNFNIFNKILLREATKKSSSLNGRAIKA